MHHFSHASPTPICMLLLCLDVVWRINNPFIITLNTPRLKNEASSHFRHPKHWWKAQCTLKLKVNFIISCQLKILKAGVSGTTSIALALSIEICTVNANCQLQGSTQANLEAPASTGSCTHSTYVNQFISLFCLPL